MYLYAGFMFSITSSTLGVETCDVEICKEGLTFLTSSSLSLNEESLLSWVNLSGKYKKRRENETLFRRTSLNECAEDSVLLYIT